MNETEREQQDGNESFFNKLFNDIRKERPYDSILVMQSCHVKPLNWIDFCKINNMPRILITRPQKLDYKTKFNTEIVAILVMETSWDNKLMESLALSLKLMRQTRILIVALNMEHQNNISEILLTSCKHFKMTNVLLYLSNSNASALTGFYNLKPYPNYHLEALNASNPSAVFFPNNWRNMHNTTLKTLPDQYVHYSMTFLNSKGELKFNGIGARLAMLFAELFNATLVLAAPIKLNEVIHIGNFINYTQAGVVDLPMSMIFFNALYYLRMAYPMELSQWIVIVPVPKRIEIREVFASIITAEVYGVIIVSIIFLSFLHSASIFVAEGRINWMNLLMDDNVIPGILGQSFGLKKSSLASLKMFYLLMFLIGVNFNTGFSAMLNHLITAPPFEKEINTFDDLRNSNLKILFDQQDSRRDNEEVLKPLQGCLKLTSNTSWYHEKRITLDRSYGYTLARTLWDLLSEQQSYFGRKLFRSPRDLVLSGSCVSIILAEDSPLKEPLDYLIQRVHQAGLRNAWIASVFLDMIKYKRVIVGKSSDIEMHKPLKANDLVGIWYILLCGLLFSLLIFLLELMVAYVLRNNL